MTNMKFKWEHVKRKAGDEFHCMMLTGSPFPSKAQFMALLASIADPAGPRKPRELLDEWVKYGLNLIDNWDIRKCMKLVELFPGCLPECYRSRKPVCDYDEKGDWALFFL